MAQQNVQVGETIINFKAPFKRITIYDAIKEHTGIDVSEMDEDGTIQHLQTIAY